MLYYVYGALCIREYNKPYYHDGHSIRYCRVRIKTFG